MTEVIPVTFDANGGKFANFTAPDTATSIVKEVDYDGTLADKAETPKKPGKAFKGWATDKDGKIPATDDDYKNLKAAKTFYAIWSDEDIQADELKVAESLGRFPKKGEPKFTNDFVPTFEDLKAKVKVKNSDGDFGPLPTTGVTFSIVDGTKEYTENSNDLKKFIYEKVKENNKDEVSRTEKVKAKITYDDGTTREVEIPITVLKNIYKGSDQGNKLPYIPNDYVKVKINPTDKAQNPDKTYYYVNPKAKVIVTGKDPVGAGDNKFSKWTIKADSDSGAGTDYTFGKRQIYGEDSTITAQYGTGIVKIAYVDQDGNKIYDKYKIAGQDYPSEKSGGLGTLAVGSDFANEGPNFKGYVFGSRDSIKGSYKDPKDSDVSTITYKYYKKVTTTKPKYGNSYFKVVFNANGGEFKTDPKNAKDVYVYFDGNDKTVKKVTFDEVREEIENTYGLPTKKMAEFKEWQDKKDKGTKVGDSKEIQFPGWVDGDYTPEVFYAHYGDASAKIKYIDLDGKPIADVYKLDDQKYPTEKTGEPGNKIESDVYTAETAPKFTGYKFNRIELNPANGKYSLDKNTTIKIYYEKVPDVIPANSDGSNPDSVPDDYVRVEFVPTDKGSIDGDKFFFVNPKKEVTIPVNNPTAKATYKFKEWKMGEDAKGEKYTPSTPKKFAQETVITATYEETENIIPYDPSATDPMVRPDGYVRVTFAAEPGLKLTESKAYYVKKNAKLKLSEIKSYETKYGYPKYKEETGYKFDKWDKPDTTEIEATDILVTAKATKLGTVIPEKNTDGSKNDKPKGYKEVTFVIKTGDEAKGSITGVAKFYVNPTEYVTINPPATKAETGYEFGAWDKDATRPTVYKEDATITGSFNGLKDVIPKTKDNDSEKPKGYVTVTFEIEKLDGKEAGKIVDGETITYFVKPNTDVTVPQPKTLANTGYKFKEWNLDTSKNAQYSKETKVKGSFTKLDDIIPATDPNTNKPNAKPEGYVAVTFDKGANGKSIEGQTVYYVNPEANPVKTLGDITKPTIKANTGYKFKDWNYVDAKAIQSNITVTAQYEEITDVVPKDNPKGGKNDKPEGYITVTFSTETNGKIKDTADVKTKVLYVNPNKASVLTPYAPKVTPNTGFDFAGWDTQIERAIKYNNNDVIKAKYNVKGDVIPQEKQDGSDKPAGYLTVTFVKGDHGELAGKKVYYVKPNKEVTVPAPTVKANVGYEFEKWDKALTQTFAEDTKITAGYKALDNIIPQEKTDSSDKPNGYVTVTFKSDANGSLTGKTVYYVKPNVDIDLTNTAKAINKNPNTGYTAEGGTWNPAIAKQKYTADAEYKFNFKALQDVIEKIDENTKKPEGYITVKLIPTDKATDKTEKVYFVNPLKDVTITNKPVGTEFTDANGITYKYTFTSWTVTSGTINSWNSGSINGQFTQDTEITAKYSTKVDYGKLVPAPVAKKNVLTPKGDTTKPEDLIENKTGLPEGTTFNYTNDGTPNVNNPGKPTAKVEVKYPNGKTVVVEVPITVVDNVVPQTGKDKPLVPKTYVKVVVDTTEKATANTKFEKTFWVKPNVEVTIPDILAPTGKQEKIGEVTKTNKFVKWKLEGSKPEKFYETKITDTFKDKESKIVATYEYGKNVEPKGKNNQWIPQGSNPSPKDFIENPYNDDDPNNKDNLPPGTKIEFAEGKQPDTNTPGTDKETTIKITYPNGETKEVPVKYNVTGDVVEQKEGEDKPKVPDNFVKVIVKTTDKATDETKFERTFWVKPNKEVTIPVNNPEGKSEDKKKYEFDSWTWENVDTKDKIKGTFTKDTVIVAQYKTTTKAKDIEQIPEVVSEIPIVSLNQSDIDKDWFKIKNKNDTDSKIKIVEITEKPATDSLGIQSGKAKVTFKNGSSRIITIKLKVVDDVIESKGDKKTNDVPDNYKLVILDSTSDALEQTKRYFWINPNKDITLKAFKPQGKAGKVFDKWERSLSINWNKEGITENVLTIKAIYKDETTPDQPGGQPGEVEKHGHRYIERVAGKDRVHTAINTSRRFFNKSRYVIIADSGNYPDALTATVLAHVLDAPILLNNTRYLEDDVAREIVRLGASEVIIVGGHKSISENVKSQLARYDQNSVQRIWGRDRYVTSSELAYEIQRLTGKVNKAIIASGENFPDALATAPLGSKEIAPILLVRRNQIDKKVDKALKDLNIMRVYVAGGPNSVSKKLEGQLPQVIRRFNGRDRYETAVLVASYTYPESKEVFVASGEVFPDALVIGPVCARRKAPILLSRTTPVKVTDDYIEKSNIEYLYIIGGTNTIYAETAHKYAIED
ncbi:cell wall-binding repeat-containing protein [Peptostreptococcus anaerobius]|uniref:cell wall-binding repeat-containing protein n=1 Tax=Peptostreptococcus anaerobius TaxID=1261 RepID=UPI0023313615|nr:cell wall-binding repeat-containing protein [Peptostreptococcus anaerobius]MDB8849760.1 cell wall-binding repeat-containing protein [Peptostreptococcus anaerobius]